MGKPIYHPYTAWEDWQAGMWQVPKDVTSEMSQAAAILIDSAMFYAGATAMVKAWPRAAEQNLTGMQQNRRAWVGQATCCYVAGIPEQATRLAWWTLNVPQQAEANRVADRVIDEWEKERDGAETLFAL